MGSNVLKDFESMYGNLTAEITANMGKLDRLEVNGEDSATEGDALIKRIGIHFEETDDVLEQMELEIRSESGSSPEKTKYLHRLECYQTELKRLKKDFKRVQQRRTRRTLLGGDGLGDNYESVNPEEQLLDNTEKLERSSRKLDMGHRVLMESEAAGAAVLNELAHQRETITRSRNRLRDTDDDLGSSGRILSGMILRIQQSRIILAGLSLTIVAVIVVGIYFSFAA